MSKERYMHQALGREGDRGGGGSLLSVIKDH